MCWCEIREWLQTGATLAAAVGVWFAWRQIQLTKEQAQAAFEEGFNSRYREIVRSIPVEALMGEPVAPSVLQARLEFFYQYMDLTNEEIRLRRDGRISDSTWKEWEEGIRGALSHPGFREGWIEIRDRAKDSFGELRDFESRGFRGDPRTWPRDHRAREAASTAA